MHAILLIISLCIIGYNLVLNLSSLIQLVNYCLATNSLEKYWDTYYEVCVHRKAIFSTIISFVLALLLFIILAPVIAIRGFFFKEAFIKDLKSGALFEYNETESPEGFPSSFYSNLPIIGLDNATIAITGKIRIDALSVITEIKTQCEAQKQHLQYGIREDIKVGRQKVNIPVLLTIEHIMYPLYIIYNNDQKEKFLNIRQTMKANGIDQVVYFSALPVEEDITQISTADTLAVS